MSQLIALFGILLIFNSCTSSEGDFTLLHYNIKELDSTKLNADNAQILALKHVLSSHKFDILSINEIQYDLPGIPNSNFTSEGENLEKLKSLLSLDDLNDNVFFPANTGENAKPKSDGTYFLESSSKEARAHADQVNFGVMPGQYSTGALFKFKKVAAKVFTDVAWKIVNPGLDLSKYRDSTGKIFPEDMSLFDKNFTDVALNIKGKTVHLILFHAVPAFNFGNAHGLNLIRNRDQLRFLEWYLTGSTEVEINIPGIHPLPKDTYFVAVGDWNVSPDNEIAGGSHIIKRLFKKLNTWVPFNQLKFTNESSTFAVKPKRYILDYIVSSRNLEILEGEIIHPEFKREDLGCDNKNAEFHPSDDMVSVDYKIGQKHCQVLLGIDYFNFKTASDHYPLKAKFKFTN